MHAIVTSKVDKPVRVKLGWVGVFAEQTLDDVKRIFVRLPQTILLSIGVILGPQESPISPVQVGHLVTRKRVEVGKTA